MKKIDLHIHTISTVSDHAFDFSMNALLQYVNTAKLDAIAITNHNIFDVEQFEQITKELSIPVFPGIEIDIENGHLLVITEKSDLEDFIPKCQQIHRFNGGSSTSFVTEEQFISVFGKLNKYLLIPHYDKDPKLSLSRVSEIAKFVTCGEVSSLKKFLSQKKRDNALVPVLFSDWRASEPFSELDGRQTYIDIEEITLTALKYSLIDCEKVSISSEDGHTLFQVLDNGLKISTGLTVVLGKRSSGKTYTLNQIAEQFTDGKYIEQFSLLSRDNSTDQESFNATLRNRGDCLAEKYLSPLKAVLDDVRLIDVEQDNKDIDDYLKALKKAATEASRQDIFSRAALYQESLYSTKELSTLFNLIDAVDALIKNSEYQDIIQRHIEPTALRSLAIDLRKKYIKEQTEILQKRYVNDIVTSIKNELQVRSSTTPIPDIDFYTILMNKSKVSRFEEIARLVKKERIIEQRNLYSYRIIAKVEPFSGAREMQKVSRTRMTFSDAFGQYENPYQFLKLLKGKEDLPTSEYYKFFAHITYNVLNQYGTQASGGERSEYNLLQELTDATRSDILLLDEPESSFDNLFLKDGVDTLLKEISQHIPVVIATHNNTIGVSVHPDYIIYTSKEILSDGSVKYHIYSGHPSSAELIDLEGNKISRRDVLLNCLEAGEPAYIDRRTSYEILNN